MPGRIEVRCAVRCALTGAAGRSLILTRREVLCLTDERDLRTREEPKLCYRTVVVPRCVVELRCVEDSGGVVDLLDVEERYDFVRTD